MTFLRPLMAVALAVAVMLPASAHAIRISGDLILKGRDNEFRQTTIPVEEILFAQAEPGAPPPSQGRGTATVGLARGADMTALQRAVQGGVTFPEGTLRARSDTGAVEYQFRNVTLTGLTSGGGKASLTFTYEEIRWD